MVLSCGIVGLPNVGKSTLFNALTRLKVPSSNYPFCTIEPNVGLVNVPDERLYKIAEISNSQKITPAIVEFVDIAGLVKGASKGEGLGNQFLSHIRGVDAIVQVVRLFEDENVTHIGEIDPRRDVDIINYELIMKDIETIETLIPKAEKLATRGSKEASFELEILKKVKEGISSGSLMKNLSLLPEEKNYLKKYQFLTLKEIIIVANVSENQIKELEKNSLYIALKNKAREIKSNLIVLSAKIEQELSEFGEEEAKEYQKELGLEKSGLEKLVSECYKALDLITFFTMNNKETKAWPIKKGSKAIDAAGQIHTDMAKGFIKAEVVNWETIVKEGSWNALREKGLIRLEGKDYEVQDGDVILIKFNV